MPFPKAEAPFSLRHVSVYVCGVCVCVCVRACAHSCPILCNPIDCSPPGSFVMSSCGSSALENRLSSCGAQVLLLGGMWEF